MRSDHAFRGLAVAVAAACVVCGTPARAVEPPAAPPADELRAATAYDAGDCATARPLIEGLDAAGRADGAMLYRLYYCQTEAADPAAGATMARARTALEAELARATDPAVAFYLANVQRNAGRLSEAQRVAAEATARVEAGRWPEPKTGMEAFRLGKLYADQERVEPATRWYTAALERFGAEGNTGTPAAVWAARFLGTREFAAERWSEAARYFGVLSDAGKATVAELDKLAAALVRSTRYREASSAWSRAVRLAPATGDRARYCENLARQAAEVGELPATAPDGRGWRELSRAELETLLLDQAAVARAARAEAPADAAPEPRDVVAARLAAARAVFVAAGLEYALRGFAIRETAFSAGYAPLVFQSDAWRLPAAD